MTQIDFKQGKNDERLQYMKDLAKKAVENLLEHVKKMEYAVKMSALEVSGVSGEALNSLRDILTTAIAIEINAQAPETIKTITYDCDMQKSETEEDTHVLWVMARKEIPDYSKCVVEETPIEELRKQEKVEEQNEQEKVNYVV